MLLSKRKRYLSGSDWVIGTLDHLMKSTTCAGNMSQVVLMLDGAVDEKSLLPALNGFVRRFPVVQGRVARDYKLTPYWDIPAEAKRNISIFVDRLDERISPASVLPFLTRSANSGFADEGEHLAFHLFTGGGKSALAMTFDHRIFDARGAEMFLHLFQQSLDGDVPSGDLTFVSSQELTKWQRKFLAGRNVNRRIIALSRSTPASLPIPHDRNKGYQYRLLTFDTGETEAIYGDAYREAGYLLESPYLLSSVTQAVHETLGNRLANGSTYLIPVTTDLRPGTDPFMETFFNHVTYLFYQVPAEQAADRPALIASFKRQMYDLVKSGFPKDLAEASLLTRIAPLPVLGRLLYLPLKGRMATFAFSHLGRSSYQSPALMKRTVENLFHMPRVPVPPGLGFFSNYYNGRLNLVISYLDGMLQNDEAGKLEAAIRKRLGAAEA